MNNALPYRQLLHTGNPLFNISFILMALALVLLPFTTWFMWPIGVLLIILWAAQGNWRDKWADFKANDGIPYGLFLLGICLIPIFGLFYSDNMDLAWHQVECYLWFLIAPLVILTTSRNLLTKNHIHFLLGLFAASALVHILVLFAHGIFLFFKTGDSTYLYYSTFSFLRHPTYVAMYTTFAYLIILVYLIDNHDIIKIWRKIFLYLAEAVMLIGVFCLYSRAGIITLVAVHIPIAIYAVHKRKAEWKWMLLVFIVIAVLFTLLMTTNFMPINRFKEPKYTLEKENKPTKTSDVRLILWQLSWKAAVENLPFGTGTGDCYDAIREKYCEHAYFQDPNLITNARNKYLHEMLINHDYNAHNQYLQVLLTNGIPGIILLLLYNFVPLGESIRRRDILLLSLFILLTLNNCFECVFYRRFGVDFIAIMIPLLMMRTEKTFVREDKIQSSLPPDAE